MKRIIQIGISLAIASVAVYLAAQPVIEPIEPIEVKPVLIYDAKQWDLTKAWYQKVTMPDGSRLELKSKIPLTKLQWQKIADDVQKSIEAEPKPEICPTCGQEYWP